MTIQLKAVIERYHGTVSSCTSYCQLLIAFCTVTIQMKATEEYFPVVLLTVLFKVVMAL